MSSDTDGTGPALGIPVRELGELRAENDWLRGLLGLDLRDEETIGTWPLLRGDTCPLPACDFKGTGALGPRRLHAKTMPAALEQSRSGNGAHVLSFFRRAGSRVVDPSTAASPSPDRMDAKRLPAHATLGFDVLKTRWRRPRTEQPDGAEFDAF